MPLNTDYFAKVGSPGTATTLASPGHSIAGTTITVVSTSNWSTDTAVIFAIDTYTLVNGVQVRNANSYTEWEGVVTSPTTIGSLVLRYGTDQVYPAGVTTRVYIPVSSSRENRLVDGILVSHDQDGTLKDGSVDATSVLANNIVTTAKILDANVTTSKIADANITKAKLDKPHYSSMFFSTGGITGGQVIPANTQTTANFDAIDPNAYGITTVVGSSNSYFSVARDGVYNVQMQISVIDGTSPGFITWLFYSFDNGATYNIAFRQAGVSLTPTSPGATYSWTSYLPAGTRLQMQWYPSANSIRMASVGSTFNDRYFNGPKFSIAEIR